MFTRTAARVALSACMILFLTSCAASADVAPRDSAVTLDPSAPLEQLEFLADPHSFTGESTAILADDAVPVPSVTPQQTLPTTVTSHDLAGDVEVTVASTQRILAMDISGSIAATVYGLGFGDRLVGRDISTTFEQAKNLPVITSSGHSVNSEAILALRPTVLITDGSIGPIDVVLQLRDAGIAVVFVDTDPSIEGVGTLAREVAAALGAPAAGDELATRLVDGINAKAEQIASLVPPAKPLRIVFLYLRGNSGVYYLFGEESGADHGRLILPGLSN